MSKLAEYIKELFDWYAQERANLLEDTWAFCYDAFRGEYSSENLAKWKALEGHEWRSKVFVRLTKQKVVAAVSQIEDIEFQGGKLPWDISPTPYPEDFRGLALDPAESGRRCELMKRRIDDNLTESHAQKRYISSLLEQSVYGLSWLKGPVVRPFSVVKPQMSIPGLPPGMSAPPEIANRFGRFDMQQVLKQIPTIEHVNLWDVFWDMETANHQEGTGVIHREMMSPGRFMDLADRAGYDKQAIELVYSQAKERDGMTEANEGPYRTKLGKRKRNIPVYEFYGRVPKKYLTDSKIDTRDIDGREAEVICVLAGDNPCQVIRGAILNFYPGGIRPMHLAKWEDLPNEAGAMGVAENLRDSQMMINSATRCFIDNKALASNLLIFGKSNALAPGQDKSLYSGKFFELANHVMDWREAMGFAQVPDVSQGLLELINMFERFADQDSNLPSMLQGETAKFSPKTAFESSQLMEAANKALGKVIRNREEGHYVPTIEALYWWEMATNRDPSIKGDYTVAATGYSTYLNKIQRGKVLSNLLTMALSNQVLSMMIDVRAHMEEIYRSSDLDADRFLLSSQEIEQKAAAIMQQINPPPGVGAVPGQDPMQDPSQIPNIPQGV